MIAKYCSLILVAFLLVNCQTTESSKKDSTTAEGFTPPKIIGGYETLDENLVYPDRAQEQNVEGRVLLRFMVTKEGRAKSIEVIQGIGYGCDQAAKTAIKKSPFTPAKKNGEPVKTITTGPIIFQL